VAAIPLSAFYEAGFEQGIARLCFAKKESTLDLALERLSRL
jgi:methionine aminotransferase